MQNGLTFSLKQSNLRGMTSLRSISGIGPATETDMIRAGIPDAETLRDLGAHDAYARMIGTGTRPHFIGYYALHMALQGRPWNDCKGAEKDALRARFDALLASNTPDRPSNDLARFLSDMGLG